jgi:dTDP-4-amino-4,6-dideoxygalactose transaminase
VSTARAHYLPLTAPAIGAEEIQELLGAIDSGWVTTGPRVAALEHDLERYLRAPYVRCLASCTAGLYLALRLAGVGPGDEVLMPTMTFVSCANAIEHLRARPVFVDSTPESGVIDLDHAATLVSGATKAIVVVHLGGHPLDMDELNAFRDRHGVTVIEDAAHAIGARWRGRPIGSHGNPTAFSFHATKNMSTFEGGALSVVERTDADRVKRLSGHGLDRSSWSRHGSESPAAYDVVEPGFKYGMTDIAAAVGIHQLPRLDRWIERRGWLARLYDERLAELPVELPPPVPEHARHAHHLYAIRIREDAPLARDAVIRGLHEARIGTSVHFAPIHRFTYFRERAGGRPAELPVAEDRARRVISLPLFPAMDERDVTDVADALRDLLA